jgi:hypothetical protein
MRRTMRERTVNYPDSRSYHINDQPRKKKPSKYRNRRTLYQGVRFDSQKEANRYQELLWMEQAKLIRKIELQPRYDLVVNGHKLGFYKADFRYEEMATSSVIVEDVKSPATKTAVYRLKKKLVKALYGVEIIEV